MADEDDKLEKELAKRWDPEKLSRFLRMREGKANRLDLTTRARYEKKFGVDLGDVRVFTGELAEEITRAHNAEALTVADSGMVLLGGSSRFSPVTAAGQALLAHELTHVAQAKPGHIQRKSVSDAPLATEASEREAEAVEQQVYHEHAGLTDGEHAAAHDQLEREKREMVMKKVVELFEDEVRIAILRNGGE